MIHHLGNSAEGSERSSSLQVDSKNTMIDHIGNSVEGAEEADYSHDHLGDFLQGSDEADRKTKTFIMGLPQWL